MAVAEALDFWAYVSDSAKKRTALGSGPNDLIFVPGFISHIDSWIAFVSIDHPPINLLDEVLSQEFDKLGRKLEVDESVRVVVLQSALPDFLAYSGLGRVGAASKQSPATQTPSAHGQR